MRVALLLVVSALFTPSVAAFDWLAAVDVLATVRVDVGPVEDCAANGQPYRTVCQSIGLDEPCSEVTALELLVTESDLPHVSFAVIEGKCAGYAGGAYCGIDEGKTIFCEGTLRGTVDPDGTVSMQLDLASTTASIEGFGIRSDSVP